MVDRPPTWLSRKEAAEYARVSLSSIDRAIKTGELQSTKPHPNGRRLIQREWVDLWLNGATAVLIVLVALALLSLVCDDCGVHVLLRQFGLAHGPHRASMIDVSRDALHWLLSDDW